MRTTQQMSITLTKELAEAVKRKVASGEYATESEVIRDGLRTLVARDRAMETWLREKVVPAYDAHKANPQSGLTIKQAREQLSARHKKATGKA